MGVLDGWRLCPRCGHELERRDGAHRHCPACGSSYWANSAPAVQGLLVRDGRVLIGRRKHEPQKGMWDLPGGFLEEGEQPGAGLRREFLEETGIEVEPVEWLGVNIDPYGPTFVLSLSWVVRGEGEPVADDDVEELHWFGPDELPEEMAFPSQNAVLRRWAESL
jgi:ADP-ribose pyrophosphatase YjhB (NUDIX family)